MWTLITLGIGVGLYIYNHYFNQPDTPRLTPQIFDLSDTAEGTAVPVVYGTTRVDTPILAWHGNAAPSDGSAWGYPFVYGVDMIFVIGVPAYNAVTLLQRVWWGGQLVDQAAALGPAFCIDGQLRSLTVNTGDGVGLVGQIQFHAGASTQNVMAGGTLINAMLTLAGADLTIAPGLRNQIVVAIATSHVFTAYSFHMGAAAQVPQVSVEVASMVDFATDPQGANASLVIQDILTSAVWKVGLPTSDLDATSFAVATSTLRGEAHGYSATLNSKQDVSQVLVGILTQINGVLFQSAATGLIKLRLIRSTDTPYPTTITADNIIDKPEYATTTGTNVYNQVRVTFPDRNQSYQQGSVIAQNLSVMAMQGGRIRTLEIQFPGVATSALATTLAYRELAAASRPLASLKCTLSRAFYAIEPGDLVPVTLPKYGLSNKMMRVIAVDLGQLATRGIAVTMLEDVFSGVGQYGTVAPPAVTQRVQPLTKRLLMEAPRYQVTQLANLGVSADPDAPVVLSCATPDDAADRYFEQTFYPKTVVQAISALQTKYTVDVPERTFPPTFTVLNNYSRIYEPYDTTSNLLIITNLANFTSLITFESITSVDGSFQLVLVTPGGQHEIISFDSITNLGGSPTQYRLNGVQRALLDTVPLDHVAGERGWVIGATACGRISYNLNNAIKAQAVPSRGNIHGSGEEVVDLLTIGARALRPYPAANQGVSGDAVVGTLGIPLLSPRNKVVSFYEEGLDFYGTKRDRHSAIAVRGDAADDTMQETVVYGTVAVPTGGVYGQSGTFFAGSIGVLYQFSGGTGAGAVTTSGVLGGACWSLDGYGSIDVGLQSIGPIPTSAKYGINPDPNNTNFPAWGLYTPRININAPSWRNLLANVRWNYQTGGLGPSSGTLWPPAWDNYLGNAGVATVTSGSFSLSKLTSGNGSYYLGTSGTSLVRGQRVPLGYSNKTWNDPTRPSNWQPRGLTAIAAGYFRNENADANDTATLKAIAYNFSPGSALLTASSTITPATANWTYREVTLAPGTAGALPSGTAAVGVEIDLTEVATGGTTNADSRATELRLFVGQFASDTSSLLANPSFDSGTTASWTVDSGAFVVSGVGIVSPSVDYVQGGANASNTIHQDFALPVGFEYGTAILRCFRAQTLSGDAGEVKVQVLDGSNVVLATATTGSETLPSLNIWYGRTLYVDTVDGAAKIRVTFIALRSLGSGNSGACFDEANLMFAKHLEASSSTSLTFDTPTVHSEPTTWQEHHVAFPSNPLPDFVFGGGAPGLDPSTEWSDAATRAGALLNGQFGGGITGIPAYGTTRIASPNQVFVRPAGAAVIGSGSAVGAYTIAGSFSVVFSYRVDEPGFASICGLLGRMNASRGWGVNFTAGGQLQAFLRGAGATQKNVVIGRVSTEGGFHKGAIVYDAAAHLLWIYDEVGGVSVSTASGLGDFAALTTDADVYLRIGTDAPDHDSFPGMIGPVGLFGVALTSGQIAAMWNYAKDPTALVTTYTRTAAAVVPLAPDSNGDTACVMAAAQVALAYNPVLAGDGGTGYGLAVGKSATNLIPDVNFAGANWVKDASTTLTQSIVDPTGRPRGVQVAGDASNGFYGQNIPLAASPTTVPFVFWAKSISGSTTLAVELRTSGGTLESTQNVTLTTLWKKFSITLTGWAGGAANCRIRFVPSAAATFQIAGVMCALQGTDFPAILPLPGATHGNYNASITTSLPKQFNYEGEIITQGVSMIDSPTPAAGTLVQATIGTNANLRELQIISGSTGFRCVHYDSASAHTDATSAYSTYSSRVWKGRARWALAGMLDNVTLPVMSAVAWTDDTHSTITEAIGRAAAWTITATNLTTVKIGAGTAAPSDVILRNVTLRAREEKLP